MKLFLIKFKDFFLLSAFTLFLSSCATLGFEEGISDTNLNKTNIKKNKCPTAKIPFKTAKHVSKKKYILRIKKIKMICKSDLISKTNLKNFTIQYKAEIELNTNPAFSEKDFIWPNIYIAIVDIEKETVLAKMVSGIEVNNKEGNLIVNKKKIRFKYSSYENLSIYFGLQQVL